MTYADRLELRGMCFRGRHGVHPQEKREAQPFEVDLVLHADLAAAAASDDLADTVDYGPLFALVREIVEGERSFDLIEALGGAIAAAVLEHTPPRSVDGVEVRVRKPKAPLGGAFETVEVSLVRAR